MQGAVLDVGVRRNAVQAIASSDCLYTGLDVPQSDDFGMRRHPEIVDI